MKLLVFFLLIQLLTVFSYAQTVENRQNDLKELSMKWVSKKAKLDVYLEKFPEDRADQDNAISAGKKSSYGKINKLRQEVSNLELQLASLGVNISDAYSEFSKEFEFKKVSESIKIEKESRCEEIKSKLKNTSVSKMEKARLKLEKLEIQLQAERDILKWLEDNSSDIHEEATAGEESDSFEEDDDEEVVESVEEADDDDDEEVESVKQDQSESSGESLNEPDQIVHDEM